MTIKCAECGENMIIEGPLAEGQHIRCPFCNCKTAYSKPSRIEVPVVVERPSARQKPPREESPEKEKEEKKPSLSIKRTKPGAAPTVDLNAQAMMRKMKEDEESKARNAQKAAAAEKKAKWDTALRIGFLVGAVALCVIAGVLWMSRRNAERHAREAAAREKALLEQKMEMLAREAEEKVRAERRAEAEKAKRERLAAEKARREKECAERKAEELRVKNVREREERETRLLREQYREALAIFGDAPFSFTNADLKWSEGENYLLRPFGEEKKLEIAVCSVSNGVRSVYRLAKDGQKTAESIDDFDRSLLGRDYLVANDDGVVFHSKRKKVHVAPIDKKKVVDLVREFFGDVAPQIRQAGLDFDDLAFEIVFVPKGTTRPIITQTVDAGVPYSLDKVREAVEEAFPQRVSHVTPSSGKRRAKLKRTVVYWDGALIKRGVDGITYVPRMPPQTSVNYYGTDRCCNGRRVHRHRVRRSSRGEQSYERWSALVREIENQEAAEAQILAQEQVSGCVQEFQRRSAEDAKYAEEIDRRLDEGTLYFRAVIKKN